ncbi:MAG: hypothetical protein QM673_17560 [Gordonia sp. (in: high G+C Gram-positive bacteria)]
MYDTMDELAEAVCDAAVLPDKLRDDVNMSLFHGEPWFAISVAVCGTTRPLPAHLLDEVQEDVDELLRDYPPYYVDGMPEAIARQRRALATCVMDTHGDRTGT